VLAGGVDTDRMNILFRSRKLVNAFVLS